MPRIFSIQITLLSTLFYQENVAIVTGPSILRFIFSALESLAEHVETQQAEQATVVPQAQPQPIYYYAPYPQAPVVNQAP